MDNNNPLSPHIQIYSWNISSLISISHRITGVLNILALTLICFWIASMLLGSASYEFVYSIFNSFFGKFLVIGLLVTRFKTALPNSLFLATLTFPPNFLDKI